MNQSEKRWHKLLNRQIDKYLPKEILNSPDVQAFLQAVNNSYTGYERDQSLSDHAFKLSEAEYQQMNNQLRREIEIRKLSISRLIAALNTLSQETTSEIQLDESNLLSVAEILHQQILKRKEIELQLIAAKEEAERADKAKSEFLSIMSHEIRSPLNAVIGMGHLLLANQPRPDQVENMNVLRTAAENLLLLINDILDFSKIEAGKVEIEESDFNLRQFLSDIKSGHQIRAKEKGNVIRLMIDDDLPDMVKGDALRIGQVLTNLVSNAIKFTKNGRITIEVRLQKEVNEKLYIFFSVDDTGIGIPEDKQKMIFEHFTQASATTSRQYGGTGLGLAISRSLLNIMGSDIYLKSAVGEGSRFYFELELKKGETSDQIIVPDTTGNIDLEGRSILLVEDLKFNILVAKQMLERWNVNVSVAENGVEALEFVKEKPFDLILMDIQMPQMDGYDATIALREMGIKTPVVALTASATNNVRKKVLEAGMQDYISKPFNPKELLTKIKKYIV